MINFDQFIDTFSELVIKNARLIIELRFNSNFIIFGEFHAKKLIFCTKVLENGKKCLYLFL